ncbi:MAG: hypothetical protein LBU14_01915 [Candidatus Peribacteria bacterium]|nr:hypothetical protein [Candidatus Peribacteria bacterium]
MDKEEYLSFLENLIIFAKRNICLVRYLEEINDDINLIQQNNLNARFVVDKWLLMVKETKNKLF